MPTSHPLLLFLLFIFYRDREKLSGREVERAMHIDLQNCSRRDQRPESLCTVLYTLYQTHHILASFFSIATRTLVFLLAIVFSFVNQARETLRGKRDIEKERKRRLLGGMAEKRQHRPSCPLQTTKRKYFKKQILQ